jgi:transposase-like protein
MDSKSHFFAYFLEGLISWEVVESWKKDDLTCQKCRSDEMTRLGIQMTKSGKVQKYHCGTCAHIGAVDSTTVNTRTIRTKIENTYTGINVENGF